MSTDYESIHSVRFKIILQEIQKLNLPKDSIILDIGCYPPYLFDKLGKDPFNFKVYGIASHHEKMDRKNVAILNIETERFPFKDNSFDLVLFSEVIEHLLGSPSFYLAQISRVLKSGAYLLITTPNATHLKNRVKMLLGISPSFPLDQLYSTNFPAEGWSSSGRNQLYFRHNREFTKKELEEIVTKENFKLVKNKYVSFYTPFRKSQKNQKPHTKVIKHIGYIITALIPSLRDSLLVVTKK